MQKSFLINNCWHKQNFKECVTFTFNVLSDAVDDSGPVS